MLALFGGIYLGWSLGANDGANVFGTAVASRIITFRKACVLSSLAIMLGAILQGEAGIDTLSGLAEQTKVTLLVISLSAAAVVTVMTVMSLPVSTSQAVIGSIVGIGLATNSIHWAGLTKVITCWVATPVGAIFFSCLIYKLLGALIKHVPMSILTRDKVLWGGLLAVGTYGSYALGANNVANATGIFSGQFPEISDSTLAIVGGFAIALGVLTYSRRVMMMVGSGVMPLDAFTAFTAVGSMAITVHIFAVIGVPVSTTQAIVGSLIGISIIRGAHGIRLKALRRIGLGWLLTPVFSLIFAAAGYAIFCSK